MIIDIGAALRGQAADAMLLMLDFDGVLHPLEPVDELAFWEGAYRAPSIPRFGRVPALAEVLAKFEEVRIVISSVWQEAHPLEELKLLLGPLGQRAFAVTGTGGRTRYESIRAWLVRAGYEGEWLALDDDDRGWALEERHRLVQCDPETGLDVATLAELRRRLLRMRLSEQRG